MAESVILSEGELIVPATGARVGARHLADDGTYLKSSTEVRFNVLDYGPPTNASVNRAYAAAGAARAAGQNAIVYLPMATYTFTPDPTTLISVPLIYPGVTFEGLGTIKTADNTGTFVGHFGAPDLTTDTSGIGFRGLTFDANLDNNPIASEAELLVFTGGWRNRRNPILSAVGAGMFVEDCQFINSVRQSVMWPGKNPGDIKRCWVQRCEMLTTVSLTDSNHDWDTTPIFIRGDDCSADYNVLYGFGTSFYISRTAIQISGSRSRVNHNQFDKYYRCVILGNPGYAGVVQDIQACGNQITNANGGIEYQSLSFTGYDSSMGPGVRGVKITDNQISTNISGYARVVGDGGAPFGIMQRGDPSAADLAVELVDISGNSIYHVPDHTTSGGHGIGFFKDPEADSSLDGTLKYAKIERNLIVNAGLTGIALRPNAITVASVKQNTIVNSASRAGIAASNTAAIRVDGVVAGLSVVGNDVIDTRATHTITTDLYLNCTSLTASDFRRGTVHYADNAVTPPVTSNNATSILRQDASHPVSRDVTTSITLALTDDNAVLEVNNAAATTVTVPPASSVPFPNNALIEIYQRGAGQVTVAAGAGVIVRIPNGSKTAHQYSTARLRYRGNDQWVLSGDVTV